MIEVFFILTTVFVAYVVYVIVGEQKSKVSATKPETPTLVVEQPTPQLVIAEDKPVAVKSVPKAVVIQPVAPKPAVTKAAKKGKVVSTKNLGLKDPTTGDVVTAYSNYRFTKRWVKDALVAEGLLEKVYKGNELNAEVDAKIKAALVKLEALDKYKV